MRHHLFAVAVVTALAALPQPCAAQSPEPASEVATGAAKVPRNFSFVVMPIPVANPAVGNGGALGAMALYKVGASKEPWVTFAGGLYTDTKSWGVAVGQKAYLGGDKFRLTGGLGGGVFNTEFFGIGQNAGRRGIAIPIRETGKGALASGLMRIAPNLYAGVETRYIDLEIKLDLENVKFPDQLIRDLEYDSRDVALGLAAEYDTRDNQFSPRKGIYATALWLRSSGSLGGDFDYNRYELGVNGYHALDPKSVVAWRVQTCWAGDDAPFFNLCSYGSQSDLRGYQAGQYIDHAMYTAQAEYRRHLFWRVGMVAFAGFGGIDESFGDMNSRDILPAGGIGLRFLASKDYGVNLRIDYAKGKGSDGVYFSIGEAF